MRSTTRSAQPASPPPAPRRRLSEADRREQILNAALEIAVRDGLEAVTARSVAAAAGLSPALVFFHFKTTDALHDALVDSTSDRMLARVPGPAAYASLPEDERLLGFLSDRLRNLDQRDELSRVELLLEVWVAGLRRESARTHVKSAIARYRDAFVPIAESAIARDPGRFRGVSAETLAHLAVSVVLGTVLQTLAAPSSFDHRALLTALRALLLPTTEGSR